MKSCTYCGKEYPEEASVCSIDGRPLHAVIPRPPIQTDPSVAPTPFAPAQPSVADRQCIIDDEHVKLLSVFHFVVGGLAFCGLVFLFLHYCLFSTVFSNPDIWKGQPNVPQLPKDFFKAFVWFYLFIGAILAIACTLNLLSGFFLRQRRHRTFSIVVGGLNCLQIPVGTILGVFTIIVLSRNSVREEYAS